MRLLRGHENHLAAMQVIRLASDADFRLAFDHMHERIERDRVFAQSLAFVEAKSVTLPVGFLTISRLTTAPSW